MYVLANRPKETQFSAHKKWQQNHQHLRVYKSFSFTFLFSHLFITYQEKEGKKNPEIVETISRSEGRR